MGFPPSRHAGLLAGAVMMVLASACGQGPDPATDASATGTPDIDQPSTTAVVTTSPADEGDEPLASEEGRDDQPPVLVACDDIAPLAPSVVGDLRPTANIDDEVMGVAMTFAEENPDIFAGLWIDREHGGTLVVAVTENADLHRAALAARGPSPDDVEVISPRPPIADERPLGERPDLAFDVVEARFTEAELRAVQEAVFAGGQPISTLFGGGVDTQRNRVSFDLIDPTADDVAALAVMIPDPAMACVSITRTVAADLEPLLVIPESIDDATLACGGHGPPFAARALSDPTPISASDHPAARLMLDVLADPPADASLIDSNAPMPEGDWFVLTIDNESAVFGHDEGLEPGQMSTALVDNTASGWVFIGWDPTCDPEVALPEGANRVDVVLDPAFGVPLPTDTELHVLVTEQACNNGEAMGDRLRGPQVVLGETDVAVAFAAVTRPGFATCPGNPSTAVTIELGEPLGDRAVVDGLSHPRAPLAVGPGR